LRCKKKKSLKKIY